MRERCRFLLRVFLAALLAGSLSGCGLLAKLFSGKEEEPKEETETADTEEKGRSMQVAGEIVSVHKAEGFVLIRRFRSGGGFQEGDVVGSLSAQGTTASLKITGERLGRFIAADIQEGMPAKGDLVTVRRLPGSEKPASTPLLEAPEAGSDAPWMKNLPPAGL